MKNLFPGYYNPSPAEFDVMWKTGLIILDANVLLDLYRYSSETATTLLETFEKLGSRLWIPYQAALEYHENLCTVIAHEADAYSDAISKVSGLLQTFSAKRGHPFLNEGLYQEIQQLFEKLNTELEQKKESTTMLLTDNPIKEKLATILTGKVGVAFPRDKLAEIYTEGESRYAEKIPPGFADAKGKQGNDRFGDLVVWMEIIEKAKTIETPVIFVTGDVKEDWFWVKKGKTIGPRPELVAELKKSKDISFHIYPTHSFLEYANKFLAAGVAKDALDEVKEMESKPRVVKAVAVDGPVIDMAPTMEPGEIQITVREPANDPSEWDERGEVGNEQRQSISTKMRNYESAEAAYNRYLMMFAQQQPYLTRLAEFASQMDKFTKSQEHFNKFYSPQRFMVDQEAFERLLKLHNSQYGRAPRNMLKRKKTNDGQSEPLEDSGGKPSDDSDDKS